MQRWMPLAVMALVGLCVPAFPWGAKGHVMATGLAIKLVAKHGGEPLKTFIRDNATYLLAHCNDPDHIPSEKANHYLNCEWYLTGSKPVINEQAPIPDTGRLPWRTKELTQAMRDSVSAGLSDGPKWAAWLAHYAADSTMPLHSTGDMRLLKHPQGKNNIPHFHSAYESGFAGYLFEDPAVGKTAAGIAHNSSAVVNGLLPAKGAFQETRAQVEASFTTVQSIIKLYEDEKYSERTSAPGETDFKRWRDAKDGWFRKEIIRDLARAAVSIVRLWARAVPSS